MKVLYVTARPDAHGDTTIPAHTNGLPPCNIRCQEAGLAVEAVAVWVV